MKRTALIRRTPLRRRHWMKRSRPKDRGNAEADAKCAACRRGEFRCYYCGLPSQVGHHISNNSVGAKLHSVENIAGLCFDCHVPGVHQFGRVEFARKMGRPVLTRETNALWEQGVLKIAAAGGEWERDDE